MNKPTIITTVYHCARCDETHEGLLFEQFTIPIEDADGTIWAWWALCPTVNEPILLRQSDSEVTKADAS